MPVGLESSGASSGPGSPVDDHHIHPLSSLSASPPSTSSDCGSSVSSCRRQSLGQLDSPKTVETYREKRKRNNDAARKSREKRRMNDVAMEARLLELTKENDLLKNRLNTFETTDVRPSFEGTPATANNSVIVVGPSANPAPTMSSSFFAPHIPAFPSFGSLPPPPSDFGYPNGFDFNFAAAAAAAGFKLPSHNNMPNLAAASIFPPHLLAAAAAALPAFMHVPPPPQPPPPSAFPPDPVSSAFLSATERSAFQRPSVVEPNPAPPRPSLTNELAGSRPTSVIQGTSRPSVVQSNGITSTSSNGCTLLDLSQSTTPMISNAPGGRIQFVGALPMASEPRGSIFASTTDPRVLPPLALLEMPVSTGSSAIPNSRVIKNNANNVAPPITQNGNSLLGSLLAANRVSPTVPQSRTEFQSGLATIKTEPVVIPSAPSVSKSVKTESDLSLAVQLHSSAASSSSASSSCSSNGHNLKSDTDSLGSPQSMRSGSEELQLQEEKHSGKKQGPDMERYRDRRRRNNEAAKRCRANRRAAFEYRSKRSQQLENENGELRQEMLKLSNELEQLKSIIAAANTRLLPTTS